MDHYRPPVTNSRVKVCVTRDQDFQDQVGSHQWFDLVNPEKVPIGIVCLLLHMLHCLVHQHLCISKRASNCHSYNVYCFYTIYKLHLPYIYTAYTLCTL